MTIIDPYEILTWAIELITADKCNFSTKFKKDLSRFTDSHSLLTDIYNRLYWRNSGLVRKYEPKKKLKNELI